MTQNTQMSEPDVHANRVSTSLRHKRPPGPRENWLLGSARIIQRDSLSFSMSMFQRYGNVAAIRFLVWPTYMIFHRYPKLRRLWTGHKRCSVPASTIIAWCPRSYMMSTGVSSRVTRGISIN
jgi:hypothetical protein